MIFDNESNVSFSKSEYSEFENSDDSDKEN